MQEYQFEFIAATSGLFALILFFCAYKVLVRTAWFWGWLLGNLGITFLLLTGFSILILLDLRSYHPMFDGEPIGSISVHTLSPGKNQLRLVNRKGIEIPFAFSGEEYVLLLNEFQWSSRFAGMGLGHGYRVSKILSRKNGSEEFLTTHVASSPYVDVWALANEYLPEGYLVTAREIKTKPLPVVDGGMYELIPDVSDILVNPLNQIAKEAQTNEGSLLDAPLALDIESSETQSTDGMEVSTESVVSAAAVTEVVVETAIIQAPAIQTPTEDAKQLESVPQAVASTNTQAIKKQQEVVKPSSPILEQSNTGKIIRTVPGAHLKATPAELIPATPVE